MAHEEKAERLCAAAELWSMGLKARPVVPSLNEALKDRSSHVRKMAVLPLRDIGSAAEPLVLALVAVFGQGENVAIRRRAAGALAEIGAEIAALALQQAVMQDTDAGVREVGRWALAALKGRSEK